MVDRQTLMCVTVLYAKSVSENGKIQDRIGVHLRKPEVHPLHLLFTPDEHDPRM